MNKIIVKENLNEEEALNCKSLSYIGERLKRDEFNINPKLSINN